MLAVVLPELLEFVLLGKPLAGPAAPGWEPPPVLLLLILMLETNSWLLAPVVLLRLRMLSTACFIFSRSFILRGDICGELPICYAFALPS